MYRFKKKQRLLNRQAFDVVFNQAVRVSNKHFVLLYCKNTLGYPRLGMAISKKAVSKAYLRNKTKRILRESFRVYNHLPSVDVVILAKSSILSHPEHLRASADNLWDLLAARCES